MPESDVVLPPGSGPAWSLTPKGRRRAKQALTSVILALLSAGCAVGWMLGRLAR